MFDYAPALHNRTEVMLNFFQGNKKPASLKPWGEGSFGVVWLAGFKGRRRD